MSVTVVRGRMRGVLIRSPAPGELPGLLEIERAAGAPFADAGMPEIAADAPGDVTWFDRFAAGYAWVAVPEGGGEPDAYLVALPVDGALHIEQVSVHPRAARRGIGAALIDHAGGAARADGLTALTLTTFTEVPWNAPYYARLGFAAVPEDEWTPGLRDVVAAESAHGLDRWPRVVMRRAV
jgi:GNAT superfamily N-acetyltransferase